MAKVSKPPVVVILGHVDHGKTSLIDYFKKTHLTDKEEGGITQNISAYELKHKNESITFIDTPGHEAFSALRARGAAVADIALLIVAADEGVQPQTKEAVSFLKKSNLPSIVVFTKSDKPHTKIDQIKQELFDIDVKVESFGGDTPSIAVSSKTGEGIEDLLDLIVLTRDMKALTYEADSISSGYVLEGIKDARKGLSIFLIVQSGVLKLGDRIVTEVTHTPAKIKRMETADGLDLKEAAPSTPVIIFGFEGLPLGGERWNVGEVPVVYYASAANRYFIGDKKNKTFSVYLHASDSGGLEALKKLVSDISVEYSLCFHVFSEDLGLFSTKDMENAQSNNALLVGFNTKTQKSVIREAESRSIFVLEDTLIYKLKERLVSYITQSSEKKEKKVSVKVLKVFSHKRTKATVGAQVIEGSLDMNKKVVCARDEQKIYGGKVSSLEKDKQKVPSVAAGATCAFVLEGNNLEQVKEEDILVSV